MIDNFQWTTGSSATPTLTTATLSSALSTTAGTASTGVSFTAAGSNLTGNITVTPQSGYEISTTSASSTFSSSAATVSSGTTVWVRFASSIAAGTYNGATAAVLSGGGASSSANVTLSASSNNVSPANDLSSAPTSITVNGAAVNGTTAGAGYSAITSDSTTKNDVWFTFTAPEQGTVTLTTTSSTSQDLDIQGWTGPSAPASMTEQSIADGDDLGNTTELATLPVTAGTLYFVRVLQYGGTAGSFTITATMPTSPSTPASNFTSSNLTSASATIGWTRGNGDAGVLVVARAGGAVNADPTNGTTYTANAAFGSGTQIGTGNYVVYKGTGTSVSVTGLSPSTAYHFAVYEYNATGLMHNKAELTGNLTTSSGVVAPSVTTSAATAIGSTTATLNGNPTADNGSAITGRGFVYSITDATPTIGEAGVTQVSLSGTTGAMSSALTTLGANTTYYFNAYAINAIGTSYGTVQSFTTSQLGAPTTLAATGTTSTGFTANWNAVTGASGYRLDVVSGGASDLIISEYLEGSSNNKYIEIFNGTGLTVDLSDYEVRLFANGAAEGSPTNTQDLSTLAAGPTTLASGACLVLKNSSAGLTLPAGVTAYSSTVANYNGDDALGIWKKSTSTYVDIFGVIESDPGSAWTTNGITTLDKTLRRKPSVTGGVTTNADSLSTLGTQWDQFSIDTASGLGSHSLDSPAAFLSSFQNADAGSNTSLNVTGASPSTQYSYVVRATSANSTSASSAVRTVTTKGTSSIAVNGGTTSLTYSGAAQGPTFTVTGSTGAVTYSYSGTGGTTYGPSSTAPTNVGSYTVTATAAGDANFDGVTSSATAFTINAASLASNQITLTPGAGSAYTASGPAGSTFDISYSGRTANGIATSYSSSSAPAAAGYYTVTATATGNYSGSNTANYFVAGPVAGNDAVIRPTNNTTFLIPRATLLQNDARIDTNGVVFSNNLSITGVAAGTGNPTVETNQAAFVTFTAGGSGVETFTYTLADAVTGLNTTGTVTVTPEADQAMESFSIAGSPGTPAYDGFATKIKVNFTGTPNTTYTIYFTTDLNNGPWQNGGGWWSGSTGTFEAEFWQEGNHMSAWGSSMFFKYKK